MRNNDREKRILSYLYDNEAESVQYLPFFFKDKKEVRRFFNMFGGKTLVLPDTYEEFLQNLLTQDNSLIVDDNRRGIDKNIHERTKNRMIEAYILLFQSLEDVIMNECKKETTK